MTEVLASIVVCYFCKATLKFIRPLVLPDFTKEAFPQIATKFQAKHGISITMGAIDGSHIPIDALTFDPKVYYNNRKEFHFVLLQGIVDKDIHF